MNVQEKQTIQSIITELLRALCVEVMVDNLTYAHVLLRAEVSKQVCKQVDRLSELIED